LLAKPKRSPSASPFKNSLEIDFFVRDIQVQSALNMMKVIEHQLRCLVSVTLCNRFDDAGVFVGATTNADGRVVKQYHETRQRREFPQTAGERGISCKGSRQIMELAGKPDDCTLVIA
jgi:hypothetical protein